MEENTTEHAHKGHALHSENENGRFLYLVEECVSSSFTEMHHQCAHVPRV